VNTINPKKGIGQLIEAMNLLGKSYPKLHLAILGGDTQHPRNGRTYVEHLIGQLRPELRARVQFLGRMDRHTGVLPYLRKAQVCCFPSHMETFGISVAEAMSVGKPTIFSETGPGPELIEEGVSGLLCNPKDAHSVASKVKLLLDEPELAARLGRNARQRAVASFDKKLWLKNNLDYYRACLQSRKPGAVD
jgi:glycosyltransferase involved in cell wall biosynthesis